MPDEPRTAQNVLDRVDDITNRWATKNKKSGSTPKTYRSRVKGLLEDYLAWKANPAGFKVDRTAPPRRPAKVTEASVGAHAPASSAPKESETWEAINLGGGRMFRFAAGDISMKDAARIAYALAARATDFDPQTGFGFSRRNGDSVPTGGAALAES